MSKYILGVDGGGTKSHLAVFDAAGDCISAVQYGTLNHENMDGSYDELDERLGELVPRVLRDAGAHIKDMAFAVFGLAGVDSLAQMELVSDMVSRLGIGSFIVCNDAVLGVPACCPGCAGICAINGTGFKIAAIDHSGHILDTCGLGSFTDDRGGGRFYGHRACGEVYNEFYKLGRPTIMRDMLFEYLGISKKEDYLYAITERLYNSSEQLDSIALNSIAFNAAAQGDAVALDILYESATQYADAISRLALDMDFPKDLPLYVTLAGSVFSKQMVRILHDMIEKRVNETLDGREVVFSVLDAPPVSGAVIWAAQKAGFSLDPVVVREVLSVRFRG